MPTAELLRPMTIRPLGPSDSFEELTELLHRAYARLASQGMKYYASWQPPEVTRRRCAEGECYLAEHEGRIVGTILFRPPGRFEPTPGYDDVTVASFGQFGVEPEYQGRGVARQLMDFVEDRARECGASALVIDTSERAHDLIATYQRRGYAIIGDVQWEVTNYRSVILRKPL